ncbi:MAG TPA: STT3 domain-containing protein [Thermoplasmata archaeon]|nr:STT3 domain-containing protein [Thermoplasmata archaeon]
MPDDERWFRKNWTTPVLLIAVFLVALFLRAYFPWGLAAPERILSGGSDSFYYERIINYCVETGGQLSFDPLLNFPMGLNNPRPPLFAWTNCVTGKALSPLFGSVWMSVTVAFLASTAVWGALTIFPLYFITKEAFGRRAGILAAFFLAVLPAHMQRSPATNADHDAMVLFFVVAGYFFFLRSLKTLHEHRWVENWNFRTKEGRSSVRAGLKVFFSENRTAILYALLAGWCITTIALVWQGWAYAPIILLVYFLFQVLVHRFRNQDPLGIVLVFAIAVGLPLLVAGPWYIAMHQVKVWYDVPLYLYLAAVGLGLVFAATRDYPWALVIPGVGIFVAVALGVLSFFYPGITDAFISGAGYFVRTKAYSTIAEAQPPGLSQIILSFGVATYFAALFGLLWMARGIPKRPQPDYLFVVVWAVAAIFMAQAAARFIFNASPAFAMASAWVTILFVDLLRFDDAKKTYRSLARAGRLSAFRRSVKARHVFGALVIVFILLLPNVWYGVDAAIPFERKAEYDRQVCNTFPSFLRPQGCGETGQGGSFTLGAFGYSLPLKSEYFPAFWSWFRTQDADVVPVEERPAFLSWWDYGFEAVDVGAHPTVADNFLDGYHLAGNFITAQSEEEAIALLDMRLLEGNYRANGARFSDGVRSTLTSMKVSYTSLEESFRHPEAFIPTINADPFKYGHYESLQAQNAQYIYGGQVLIDALDSEGLTSLNHALREAVGASIRYFAVDTRLFPLDGSNTGIFYAPAKLSDHRILELADGRTIPRDFFSINATTSNRGTIPIEQVRPGDQVTALRINYKEMFYRSMFYRAFAGFAPSDVGVNCNDCIPGLPGSTNQQIQNVQPLQAWNLSHFKLVYRTAYYNPYPSDQLQNHTDAWVAMEASAAQELQGKINRGEATGVVDASQSSTIRRGIVVVKYYDGAFLNGTVRLGGVPWPGVRISVHDEFGVPHDTKVTDANGTYSVLLPFGNTHVQATIGPADSRVFVGNTTVGEFVVNVSDAASMRQDVDMDDDGIVDWLLRHDFTVPAETLDGSVFLDVNHDQTRNPGEPALGGANVTLAERNFGVSRRARTDGDGHLFLADLYPGTYDGSVAWRGRTIPVTNLTIQAAQPPKDLAIGATTLLGSVMDQDGHRVGGASVVMTDATNGTVYRATARSDGAFVFQGLLGGPFNFSAAQGTRQSLPDRATVPFATETAFHNVTVYASANVTVRSTLGGAARGFVTLTFEQRSAARLVRIATTDASGQALIALPAGTWDVHARHYAGTALFALVGSLTIEAGQNVAFPAALESGAVVGGTLFSGQNRTQSLGGADIVFRSGAGENRVRADLAGRFLTYLPLGTYTIQVSYQDQFVFETRAIASNTDLQLGAVRGVAVSGSVFRAFPPGQPVQIEDPIRDATVAFRDATRSFQVLTQSDGQFTVALPTEGGFALTVARSGYLTLERPALSVFQWQGNARFSLFAENVTVSGALSLDGAPFLDPSLPVTFRATGPGAVDTVAALGGAGGYSAVLPPGRYRVEVDRDETGNGDVRLQLAKDTTLTVNVGDPAIALDLELVHRLKVSGTVVRNGQPRSPVVRFEGPEVRTVNATSGSFTAHVIAGAYTVTANLTEGAETLLAIATLEVTGPTTVALSLVLATNVTGSVTFESGAIDSVPITFARVGGGIVRATSDSVGQYNALLLGGGYTVSVDHVGTAQAGAGVQYVRYTFTGSLTVGTTRFQLYPIALSRTLANTTVSGTVAFQGAPAAAELTFLVRGVDGLNATAAASADGRFTASLQPGQYDVYAFAPLEGAAFLGQFDLLVGTAPVLDLVLVPGVRVSGVTTVRAEVRSAANVTFTTTLAHAAFRSSSAGDYDIVLPATTYSVSATAAGTERGVAVTYRATASLALSAPSILNLALTKVVKHAIEVTWDSAERATIRAGDSVDYTLVVKNTGNEDDTLLLSAVSTGFSFEFSRDRVSLPFGTSGNETTVRVTVTAAPDAKVDHGPISVTVRSDADPSVVRSALLQVDIVRYRGLTASVSSAAPTWDGSFLTYTLEIKNTGNGAEEYRITIPNLDELTAAGWRATLVGATGSPTTDLSVVVPGNATQRPVLRFQKDGGSAGASARVHVVSRDDPSFEALFTVTIQMPRLAVDGSVRAGGSGVSTTEPGLDLATTAFLISLIALIAAAVYLSFLRRRSE